MKAGLRGPMKKNFPSAFQQTDFPEVRYPGPGGEIETTKWQPPARGYTEEEQEARRLAREKAKSKRSDIFS